MQTVKAVAAITSMSLNDVASFEFCEPGTRWDNGTVTIPDAPHNPDGCIMVRVHYRNGTETVLFIHQREPR
jgi:hypothetical protein